MIRNNRQLGIAITSAIALLVVTGAAAAPVITALNSSTELAYSSDKSVSDLLRGKTATTTGWNLANWFTTAELNDGIHGRSYATAGNNVEGTWITVGATATYNLDTGSGGLGWDINSIQPIAAWNSSNFGIEGYNVSARPRGVATFTTLATVNYQPITSNAPAATKVTLTDDGRPILKTGMPAAAAPQTGLPSDGSSAPLARPSPSQPLTA